MNPATLDRVTTLAFDIFGTVLDLTGSIMPPLGGFLAGLNAGVDASEFWAEWRARQRIEQYQDTIIMLGHSGYLETCRRALVYCLRNNHIAFSDGDVEEFMGVWRQLRPFEDAVRGLRRLGDRFRLVALSNGEPEFLDHLIAKRIGVPFDRRISVEEAGAFKPHPSVYRTAAGLLECEPHEIMMVAAHSFDIMGARACGFRGAFVNRYGLPFEDAPLLQPDLVVDDFEGLASKLLTPVG